MPLWVQFLSQDFARQTSLWVDKPTYFPIPVPIFSTTRPIAYPFTRGYNFWDDREYI